MGALVGRVGERRLPDHDLQAGDRHGEVGQQPGQPVQAQRDVTVQSGDGHRREPAHPVLADADGVAAVGDGLDGQIGCQPGQLRGRRHHPPSVPEAGGRALVDPPAAGASQRAAQQHRRGPAQTQRHRWTGHRGTAAGERGKLDGHQLSGAEPARGLGHRQNPTPPP